MFNTDLFSSQDSGANCRTQQASLLASTQTLTIGNQCPMVTGLIPGRIRQPWKQPLQTFSNASKFRGYRDLDAVLSRLPFLRKVEQTGFSLTTATEAGMLPRMEGEEEHPFTPSEVLLYQHPQDRR